MVQRDAQRAGVHIVASPEEKDFSAVAERVDAALARGEADAEAANRARRIATREGRVDCRRTLASISTAQMYLCLREGWTVRLQVEHVIRLAVREIRASTTRATHGGKMEMKKSTGAGRATIAATAAAVAISMGCASSGALDAVEQRLDAIDQRLTSIDEGLEEQERRVAAAEARAADAETAANQSARQAEAAAVNASNAAQKSERIFDKSISK